MKLAGEPAHIGETATRFEIRMSEIRISQNSQRILLESPGDEAECFLAGIDRDQVRVAFSIHHVLLDFFRTVILGGEWMESTQSEIMIIGWLWAQNFQK